jgi:hypothetical protein
MMTGEGRLTAQESAGAAIKSATGLLVEAERTARLRGSEASAEGAALASVAQGWISMAGEIMRLADQGVYIELEKGRA